MSELGRHSDVSETKRQETTEVKPPRQENYPSAQESRSTLDNVFGRLFVGGNGEKADSGKDENSPEPGKKELSAESDSKEVPQESEKPAEAEGQGKGEIAEARKAVPKELSNVESLYGSGSYKAVEKYEKEHGIEGHEKHHTPSDEASDIAFRDGPCISMDEKDHHKTASWGRSKEAQLYREAQAELVKAGRFREAFEMDVEDIRSKFGDKYDAQIAEASAYVDKLEKAGIV